MKYLDVLTHTSFPEQISKITELITVILHIHNLPSCAFSGFLDHDIEVGPALWPNL